MIFYEEIYAKAQEAKQCGYTVKELAEFWGVSYFNLRAALETKKIYPSLAQTLEQTIKKEFDRTYELNNYPYLLRNSEVKYAFWFIKNRLIGLPHYQFNIYEHLDYQHFKEKIKLPKNEVIINTIKVEMLLRNEVKRLIVIHGLTFFENIDFDLQCPLFMLALKEKSTLYLTEFYKLMGVSKNEPETGRQESKELGRSGSVNNFDTSSIDFKPSQIIKSKL